MRVNKTIGIRQRFLSTVRGLEAKSHFCICAGRQHKWILAILLTLVLTQSYVVRELLSALLLFTVLFVILTFLMGLFVLIDHAIYSSIGWAESVARSFRVHHPHAMTARVQDLVSRPAHGSQKLDHA